MLVASPKTLEAITNHTKTFNNFGTSVMLIISRTRLLYKKTKRKYIIKKHSIEKT